MGSININGGVYKNPMSDIRFYAQEMKSHRMKPFLFIFDLSMFHRYNQLKKEGLISPPYVYGFIFDVPDGPPFTTKNLDIFLGQLPRGAPWFLIRHHSKGWKDFREALERGGHVRVGYEDSPFLASGKRARSNADLVKEIARQQKRLEEEWSEWKRCVRSWESDLRGNMELSFKKYFDLGIVIPAVFPE